VIIDPDHVETSLAEQSRCLRSDQSPRTCYECHGHASVSRIYLRRKKPCRIRAATDVTRASVPPGVRTLPAPFRHLALAGIELTQHYRMGMPDLEERKRSERGLVDLEGVRDSESCGPV